MFANIISVLTLISTIVLAIAAFRFNKSLETQKYLLQRSIKDFELYTVKRHETYPELFKLILFAHSKITGLRGHNYSLTFEEYNSDDIKIYLEGIKIPAGKIIEITSYWDSDRDFAIKEIRKYEKLRKFQDSRNAYNEAVNFLYLNELYISEEVVESTRKVLNKLSRLLINYEYPDSDTNKENPKLIEDIGQDLNETKEIMRKELSISYYESKHQ